MAPETPAPDAPTRLRVMIVDDNQFSRQLLKSLFEGHGHQVVGMARGVTDATELYKSLKPDIVTLDLILGHEYGFRALMAMRRLDPKVRVIVVSSDAHPFTMEQATNLGAVGYVVKPVDWEKLSAALSQAAVKPAP